jgi:hypothetical protein
MRSIRIRDRAWAPFLLGVERGGVMEAIFFRFFKASLMAAIMLASGWMLSGDARIAIMLALIPFVLGAVNIQTHLAYMLTAAVFLAAVGFQILGQDVILDVKQAAQEFAQNARVIHNNGKTSPPTTTAAPAPDAASSPSAPLSPSAAPVSPSAAPVSPSAAPKD